MFKIEGIWYLGIACVIIGAILVAIGFRLKENGD